MAFALWCYLAVVNIAAFLLYGFDKRPAKRNPRNPLPEAQLFGIALQGGCPGACLGMQLLRHNTLHRRLKVGIPAIVLAPFAPLWVLGFN